MDAKPKGKIIAVHRIVGRYEVEGKVTCIPAPRPGQERAFVDSLIDEQVEKLVKDRMLKDLLSPS